MVHRSTKLGGNKRYHVHRILMPDGSVFNFENKKTEPNGVDMITNNGKQGSTISSALNKSISDSQQKGNKMLSLPDTDSNGLYDPLKMVHRSTKKREKYPAWSREEILKDIIRSSQTSNEKYDRRAGIRNDRKD